MIPYLLISAILFQRCLLNQSGYQIARFEAALREKNQTTLKSVDALSLVVYENQVAFDAYPKIALKPGTCLGAEVNSAKVPSWIMPLAQDALFDRPSSLNGYSDKCVLLNRDLKTSIVYSSHLFPKAKEKYLSEILGVADINDERNGLPSFKCFKHAKRNNANPEPGVAKYKSSVII
ncbi:hypothetical protein BDR26DRAFT_8559 [Obelidium mucronatum]|nr:hypothetical protein BDR26DRAFT_8559 [Obelidium mucronatum]